MKKTIRLIALLLVLTAALTACGIKGFVEGGGRRAPEGLWQNAVYTQDTTLGEGAKTVTLTMEMEEKSVTFTVKTDAETVGAALMEHQLIDGDEGPYGLYIKTVNGVVADYDKDQHYWAFYVGEDYAMQGIELTPIDESARYRLVYAQ